MPLLEMSPNVREIESRKRSHDEFFVDNIKAESSSLDKSAVEAVLHSDLPSATDSTMSPRRRSPALTDAGRSTPAKRSLSPQTPTKAMPATRELQASTSLAVPSATTPPAKRKRLTPAEKEAREKELAAKKKEKEEKLVKKAAEKAKAEEGKAAKAKERDEKRKKKEAEELAKAEKRRKKEEEQQRLQEEKERKDRSQMRLNNFFKLPATPKKTDEGTLKVGTLKDGSPAKPTAKVAKTEYERRFHKFFVKENTRLADPRLFMDEETREAKSEILDEYISGKRGSLDTQPVRFDPVELFSFLSKPPKRGRLHHPVRHIMEQVYKETEKSDNADDARKILTQAREKLAKVPMKVIAFSQDVRPPYCGTVTFKPFALGLSNMSQVARRPTGRRLPLEYDYDSEAEWQEEEGEDLDAEDEEEELDEEDDMEEFLDDSEDSGLARRIFGANTMEPLSTGICFENAHRQGPNASVYEHKMEFMHGGLDQTWGINPFSTEYWEPEPKAKTGKAAQTADASVKMAPPPAPANAFAALTTGVSSTDTPKLVKSEVMNDVKQLILDNKALSKIGIIDFIFNQFRDRVSRIEVKNTLEFVAEKKGVGRQKAWTLKPGHEIV